MSSLWARRAKRINNETGLYKRDDELIVCSPVKKIKTDLPLKTFIELQKAGAVCAGGYPRYLMTKRNYFDFYNDIDFFIKEEDESKILDLLNERFVFSLNITYGYRIASNVIGNTVVQIISLDNNNIKEIFSSFDFTICQAAVDFQSKLCYVTPEFLRGNAKKELVWNQKNEKIPSPYRINDYLSKCYKMKDKELIKILFSIKDDEEREHFIHKCYKEYIFDKNKPKKRQKVKIALSLLNQDTFKLYDS